jgi:hypothetical protein
MSFDNYKWKSAIMMRERKGEEATFAWVVGGDIYDYLSLAESVDWIRILERANTDWTSGDNKGRWLQLIADRLHESEAAIS